MCKRSSHAVRWRQRAAFAITTMTSTPPFHYLAKRRTGLGLALLFFLCLAFMHPSSVAAQGAAPASDLACRLCHEDTDQTLVFPSGEEAPARIDIAALDNSAHGLGAAEPLACTACHQPLDNYRVPHAPLTAADSRSYAAAQAATCTRCHTPAHLTSHPGQDAAEPVICTDCHTAHEVQTAAAWTDGAGVDACLACHDTPQRDFLANVVQAGLFEHTAQNSDYCLACHSQPGLSKTFPDGETVSLTIDAAALHDSVHGAGNEWQALSCRDCHGDYTFPHEATTATSRREFALQMYTACARCHEDKYELTVDSVHGTALAEGDVNAAVCTDCHGAHDTPVPNVPRARISHTCEKCHSEIFNEYAQSVHGEALLEESNEDVPTCIECHGVHNIGDPTTNLFRIRSPELCAECHADVELMTKYEISTNVFDSYVADFHGTTVTLFQQMDPNVETNKAVCYDCHGVHNILAPDDPDAGIKANLLATCQQCHPDASANFPDAWASHFEPSLEHNPLVYLVNLFYKILIPSVVGFFTLLVATDIYRRIRLRLTTASRSES